MEYLKGAFKSIYAGLQELPMTVVESLSTKSRKDYTLEVNQIRDITGANDNEAWDALKEGSFDLAKAIQILNEQTKKKNLEPSTQSTSKEESMVVDVSEETEFEKAIALSLQEAPPQEQSTSGKESMVIDLTDEKENSEQDIEKAIALSLQQTQPEATNISNEQRDISRALEASFNDSKPGGKRTRTDFWQTVADVNPHTQKRKDNYPVGLRNVGNTCWFSAVVQSLFHIPAFRKTILEFACNQKDDAEGDRKVMTVRELQKLFASMIESRKKYIDPSDVIQCLRNFFKEDLNQQDVSEFMIKLIDYLEDTFKPNCQTTKDVKSLNPVAEMFYGQYVVEGTNAGQSFTKEETFGAYPLQIAKHKDLHESVEGAMVHNNIESAELDEENTNTQEHWFTRLPAVLILELSRFRFNQKSQQPEKIHNRLEFEENMYMDRYMKENRARVRELRKKIRKLKTEKILSEKDDKPPDTESDVLPTKCESPEEMEISDDESHLEEKSTADVAADAMYQKEDLKKIVYRLHAVLVHKGEANGGHYWAFIYDAQAKTWRKFNDITVSDVTWEEVRRESVGGCHNASAYCLIYTDRKKATELYNDNNWHIAEELKKLVDEDNKVFEEELKEWDKKESTRVEQDANSARETDSTDDMTMETENTTQLVSEERKDNRAGDNLRIQNDFTKMVSNTIDRCDGGVENAFKDWCKKEKRHLKKRAAKNLSVSKCQSDVRLEHKAIYMIRCDAPCDVTDRAIVETFLQETRGKVEQENTYNIHQVAEKILAKELPVEQQNEYKTWKEYYSTFQKANLAFINGFEYLSNYKYMESLSYLSYAAKLNSQLPANGQLNKDLLSHTVGLCLQKLSKKALAEFTTGSNEDARQALDVMTKLVIPSMNMSDCPQVAEHIREQWLTPCLDKPHEGRMQEAIEDFLNYLVEGKTTSSISEPPLINCHLDCKTLSKKFSNILTLLLELPIVK